MILSPMMTTPTRFKDVLVHGVHHQQLHEQVHGVAGEKRLVSFGILDVYFTAINIKDPAGVHDLTPVVKSMDKIIQIGTVFRIILSRSS